MRREHRTPLVVFTPKSMLRATQVRSRIEEFETGSFQTVLDDPTTPRSATRVILATGKIAHEAFAHRDEIGADHVAIVRLEQIYPWPQEDLSAILAQYSAMQEVVWLQEEPENMGAWPFVHHQLHRNLRDGVRVSHVARAESASPATGSSLVHTAEQADLLKRSIG